MRIHSKATALTGIAAGTLLVLGGVAQAYTLDTATGAGFVGKGEVQSPFGWNNAALQANAAGVSFSYEATEDYSATCTWVTGEGTRGERTHNVTHSKSTSISSAVTYEPRQRNQITGFTLTGFGATTETGETPVVGGPCPGNQGHDGTWTAVVLTNSTGGLYAHYGALSALLTPTV
jgi:hypothetical protein